MSTPVLQTLRWDDPNDYIWENNGLRALFIIQRTGKQSKV